MSSKQFLKNIPKSDKVVLTTARAKRHKDHTIKVLEYVGIKYNQIIATKLLKKYKPTIGFGDINNKIKIKTKN